MRALRFLRAWLAFKLVVHWMPDRWAYGDGVMHRVWFWLLPWAGDWAFANDRGADGRDPWGPEPPQPEGRADG